MHKDFMHACTHFLSMHTFSLFNIIPTIYVATYVPVKDPDFHDSIQVIIQLFLLALKLYCSVDELP